MKSGGSSYIRRRGSTPGADGRSEPWGYDQKKPKVAPFFRPLPCSRCSGAVEVKEEKEIGSRRDLTCICGKIATILSDSIYLVLLLSLARSLARSGSEFHPFQGFSITGGASALPGFNVQGANLETEAAMWMESGFISSLVFCLFRDRIASLYFE